MQDTVHHAFHILQSLVKGNLLQDIHGREHGAEILLLVRAAEVHLLEDLAPAGPQGGLGRFGIIQRTEHQCLVVKCGSRLGRTLPHQRRHALLEDAGLFSGDFPDGVAEQLAVVQADIGHDAQVRFQDIGAVEPAAEPRFDDGRIDVFVGKPLETETGGNLEERETVPDEIRLPLCQEIKHILLRDHLSADPDAFTEVPEMGRGEKTCPKPRG